jgi:hypothetical protein
LGILDLANFERNEDPDIRNLVKGITYPGIEYKHIDRFTGHFITILRMSLGDFNFDAS